MSAAAHPFARARPVPAAACSVSGCRPRCCPSPATSLRRAPTATSPARPGPRSAPASRRQQYPRTDRTARRRARRRCEPRSRRSRPGRNRATGARSRLLRRTTAPAPRRWRPAPASAPPRRPIPGLVALPPNAQRALLPSTRIGDDRAVSLRPDPIESPTTAASLARSRHGPRQSQPQP